MRALLWWPGAQYAIFDVAAGIQAGLEAHGVELIHYRLDAHLQTAGYALEKLWRVTGRSIPKYSHADVMYEANKGVLERALRAALQRDGIDWVIAVSGMYQHPDYLLMLRAAGLRVALVCTESPYNLAEELARASLVDLVWTNERTMVPAFRTRQPRTYYLPHAWHPELHEPSNQVAADVPAHDVVFVGTGFPERIRLLEAIDWRQVGDCGIYGEWSLLGARSRLRRLARVTRGSVPNARTTALYRRAVAGLNLHRTSVRYERGGPQIQHAESMNPRCYELAATGCFFVTDARAEVREVFGEAVPTFATPGECEALLRRAMREPTWRADCVAAARERIAPHSWLARGAQMVDQLEQTARAAERAA